MPDENAHRFNELHPDVQRMLSHMRKEHVETLEYLATVPKPELQGLMKMSRDIKAISKFFRWLIIGCVAFFFTSLALYEAVLKALAIVRGAKS